MTTVIAPDAPLYDPFSPEWHNDAAAFLNRLRENDPVHWSELGYWVVSRYDDVAALLRDPRLSYVGGTTDRVPEGVSPEDLVAVASVLGQSFNFMDPPDHTRLRRLVSKAFAAQATEKQRPRMQAVVDSLLDAAAARGQMDLVADFAYPLPIIVTSATVGIPDEDRERFRDWFTQLRELVSPAPTQAGFAAGVAAFHQLSSLIKGLVNERRQSPADDLISGLVQAEDAGDVLDDNELIATVIVVFGAAGTTTESLIAKGVVELVQHPDQLELLRRDPSLIEHAVEELLRFNARTTVGFLKRATVDIEVGGKMIRAGEQVSLSMSSANRDPEAFADPDRLDITRTDNKHLAFGAGAHFCMGANLARTEAQIAIGTLVQRFRHLQLDEGAMARKPIPSNDWDRVPVACS